MYHTWLELPVLAACALYWCDILLQALNWANSLSFPFIWSFRNMTQRSDTPRFHFLTALNAKLQMKPIYSGFQKNCCYIMKIHKHISEDFYPFLLNTFGQTEHHNTSYVRVNGFKFFTFSKWNSLPVVSSC